MSDWANHLTTIFPDVSAGRMQACRHAHTVDRACFLSTRARVCVRACSGGLAGCVTHWLLDAHDARDAIYDAMWPAGLRRCG